VPRQEQNYALSTDPKTPGAKVPSTLEIADVELLDAYARKFSYDGRSTGRTPDGRETSGTQHVEATSATMKRFRLGKIVHDADKAQTILSGLKLDAGEKPASYDRPFAIRGLSATFVSGIGDKPTTTKLVTDVEAGPLSAEKITFDTVNLGTEIGPDGKSRPVTATRINGAFELTRFGLINPNLTITNADGETVLAPVGYGKIEIKGLKPRVLPNGTMYIPFDELSAEKLVLTSGVTKVELDFAAIRNVQATLQGLLPVRPSTYSARSSGRSR